MTIKDNREALFVKVPRSVYLSALVYVEKLGRPLRMDSYETQGVSTEWFTRSAFLDGDKATAHKYVDLERAEWSVVGNQIFRPWLQDVIEICTQRLGVGQAMIDALRVPREIFWTRLDELSIHGVEWLHAAVDANDEERFEQAQAMLRESHITANDLYVEWLQDLFTALAKELGDDAVEEAMRTSYASVWRNRYAAWFEMSPEEKLAWTCAGMRAHYGGPGRRGDFVIEDRVDAFVLSFDPCGTGGVLRRRAAGNSHIDAVSGNQLPQPWSWGRTNVPWYCAHCPMLLEQFPIEDFGIAMRPVEFSPDPHEPTRWLIPKVQAQEKLL